MCSTRLNAFKCRKVNVCMVVWMLPAFGPIHENMKYGQYKTAPSKAAWAKINEKTEIERERKKAIWKKPMSDQAIR